MESLPKTETVANYALPNDKVEAFLAYPGARPEGSFITDGETVTHLPDTYSEFVSTADEMLLRAGLPLIADRIPVLAYGANANPTKLANKMEKFNDQQTVPHCAVQLPDTAAVWHGQPGQVGSYFAELYRGPEVQGTTLNTHVAFLTLEQLGAIDTTEGVTYTKYFLPAKLGLGEDAPDAEVLAYVALDSQVLLKNAEPVLVDTLRHRASHLVQMTAREAVVHTLNQVSDELNVAGTPEDFIAAGVGLTLQERKDRQSAVRKVMEAKGISRPYSAVTDNPDNAVPRLDFASLTHEAGVVDLHRLPQMVWSDREKVRLNTNRAFKELELRLKGE